MEQYEKRIYPGNIEFNGIQKQHEREHYLRKANRFINELDVSIYAINRSPHYQEMVDCLLTINYEDRLQAFGILVLIGFFERPEEIVPFCNSTFIEIKDLRWIEHFDLFIFCYIQFWWCKLNLHRYLDGMKTLFLCGMKKESIPHDYVFGTSPSNETMLFYPTYTINHLHDQFDNIKVLYDYMLEIFSHSEIISIVKIINLADCSYPKPIYDAMENFISYTKSHMTLFEFIENMDL